MKNSARCLSAAGREGFISLFLLLPVYLAFLNPALNACSEITAQGGFNNSFFTQLRLIKASKITSIWHFGGNNHTSP